MKRIISLLLICTLLFMTLPMETALAAYDKCPFTDLEHVYHKGYFNVMSLVEKGIISGKTETTFAPSDPVTRQEAAKIIVLASKAPLSSKTGSFTDAVSGEWYEPYIETANETGLITGKGDGTFGIDEPVTRQDAAVLAVRMADYMGIDIIQASTYDIGDIADVSDYASDAVKALVNMNVADLSDGSFKPLDNITRLQLCVFIDRILISDDNLYDDYLNDWMPVEKDVTEYQSEVLAFEDFENGLTTLQGYNSTVGGVNALNYIVTNSGKDSSSSLKVPAGTTVNLYLTGVEAGAEYFFSYDIKTEGLDDNFARINYEWYNSSGNMSGLFERNNDVYGDKNWITHTATTTAPTPDTMPEFLRIAISIRDSDAGDGTTTGSVQIDNFKIYKVVYEPLTTYLKKPAYKGVITDPNGEADIRITSYIKGLDSVYERNDYYVVADLSDFSGKSYFNSRLDDISPEMDITFSSKSLAIGDYDLSVKFIENATDQVKGENHWVIRKRAEDFMPKYFFDEYGRMLKNGEPYFGIGAYAYGLLESDLEDFKDTPIEFMIANSLGNYWEKNSLFKTMAEYGLSSIMSAESFYKDAIRGQYQNEDVTTIASERPIMERIVEDLNLTTEEGHMGYQINNESPAAEWARRIAWHNQILSDIDLEHITFGVGASDPIGYARCHDIYAVDPYPITGAETDEIWAVYEQTKDLADGTANRPIWTAVQISDLKVMGGSYASRERGPNETELRNMAWQAVCGGAQAVVWYAHFHLDKEGVSRPKSETFPEVIRVSEELDKYSDVIMSAEDAPDVRLTAADSEKFAHLVRRYNGKTYVFLVNMSSDPQNISLYLNDASSISGEYSGENYSTGAGGKLEMTLDGLGVEILTVNQTEQASPDCTLSDVQFSDGENSYFIVREDSENILYIPEGANTLHYNADIHPDARIIVNGCPNESCGTINLEGKDKIRFTVISEDGQHFKQHWYKIVRN